MPSRAVLDLGEKPQGASRRHAQAERVGADDALPFPALLLPQTIEGLGVTACNFHCPAVTGLAQDGVKTQSEIGGAKRRNCWERFASPRRVEAVGGRAPHDDAPEESSGPHGGP